MSKCPNKAGDIDHNTGRVAVCVADYAKSDLNGEEYAYLFKPHCEEWGMDPWRVIDGVDTINDGASFDIWGAANWCKQVGPNFLIFVSAKHAAQFAAEAA